MTIHPFLEKQGITSYRPHTGSTNRELELGISDVDKQVTCSEERGVYFQVTLESGQNICQREITDVNTDPTKIQLCRQDRYLEYFRLEGKFDKLFDELRLKWSIPIEVFEIQGFYEYLSHNQNELFLPDIIKSQELINDINQLCIPLRLRSLVKEEFWVVSAFLLFGELLYPQTGFLSFFYTFPLRIFKVLNNGRYQLFLEAHPSLDIKEWENLYRPIKTILREQTEFVPSSGDIKKLSEYIGEDLSHEFKDVIVFPIPSVPENLDSWRSGYNHVRTQLNVLFGKTFDPHEKSVNKRSQRVIEECKLVPTSEKLNSKKFREITDNMQIIFPEANWEEDTAHRIWKTFKNKRNYELIEFDARYDYEPEDDVDLKDFLLAIHSKEKEDRE